jgi:hypothetical protein
MLINGSKLPPLRSGSRRRGSENHGLHPAQQEHRLCLHLF